MKPACNYCKQPIIEGRKLCTSCSEKHSKSSKARYVANKSSLCSGCKWREPEVGYKTCSICRKARLGYHKIWRPKNRSRKLATDRKSKYKCVYGITLEIYNQMLKAQGGVCAICHKEDSKGNHLSVDHDHSTGKVRGLLCGRCNLALGGFSTQELLEGALKYLKVVNS